MPATPAKPPAAPPAESVVKSLTLRAATASAPLRLSAVWPEPPPIVASVVLRLVPTTKDEPMPTPPAAPVAAWA